MREPAGRMFPPSLVAVLCAASAILIIIFQSPQGMLFFFTDGLIAAGVLLAASLAGLWLVALLRFGELPLRWHLLLGAGLGIGALSLLALCFGLLGVLSRPFLIGLLVSIGLAGMVRLVQLGRRPHLKSEISNLKSEIPNSKPEISNTNSPALRWLWLLAGPFAALALLVALIPSGFLWAEEGNGYDVLEYHLQMPREYMEAGQIAYAPHNVYANFPANAEMLYLLAMIVQGDPIAGAGVAQLINAFLAFLAVAAAWLAGREVSAGAGHISGLLAATCGWLVYLSGVAYVENAMLFFGMLSAAALCRIGYQPVFRGPQARAAHSIGSWRWLVAAGLLAGLSAGCKYTAAVLVAIPLGLAVLSGRWESHRRRIAAIAAFGLSAMASFAPWLLKNAAFTSNPVFPLAGGVFRNYPEGWSRQQAEHFAQSHALSPEESSLRARLGALWSKVVAEPSQRFGPAVFLLAGAGLAVNRRLPRGEVGDENPRSKDRDRNLGPAVMLLAQVVLWLAFTHLYARFAVAFVIPLVVLGGHCFAHAGSRMRWAGLALLIAGSLWNLAFIADLYRKHLYVDGRRISLEGAPQAFTGGFVPGYEHLKVINGKLPTDAKILLVGEARAFYFLRSIDYRVVFSRDPVIELLRTSPPPQQVQAWLAERGFTHLYVAWSEIRRLSRSRYGFHGLNESQIHAMIESLATGGAIKRTHSFAVTGAVTPYAELYGVNLSRP